MRTIAACPFPHPALRATFSRWEKAMRKASLRDFDNSGLALYRILL
jgi:hypothetical protein